MTPTKQRHSERSEESFFAFIKKILRFAQNDGTGGKFIHETAGFSLLEVALVLAIMGILAGTTLPLLGVYLEKQARQTTLHRLDQVLTASELFSRRFGRVPCPGSPRLTGEPMGAEMGSGRQGLKTPEKCRTHVGLVPYRTLGLPADAALDGWNRPITYAITPTMGNGKVEKSQAMQSLMSNVNNAAGGNLGLNMAEEGAEEDKSTLNICDHQITKKTPVLGLLDQGNIPVLPNQTLAVLAISHGRNGGGAYSAEGTGLRSFAGPAEQENMDDDLNYSLFPFVKDGPRAFDDIIEWRTVTQLAVAFNGRFCEDEEEETDQADEPAMDNPATDPNMSDSIDGGS